MKKLTVMLLVMTLVFGLAACGNASEKGSTVTETQAQSAEDTGAGNAELNKLYEKENAIIAKKNRKEKISQSFSYVSQRYEF